MHCLFFHSVFFYCYGDHLDLHVLTHSFPTRRSAVRLLLGMVGTDVNSGVARYDFGIPELQDGIDFAIVAMGVFGFAEILSNLEQKENRVELQDKIGSLYPNRQEIREAGPAIVRGTALGSMLGILPGGEIGRAHV